MAKNRGRETHKKKKIREKNLSKNPGHHKPGAGKKKTPRGIFGTPVKGAPPKNCRERGPHEKKKKPADFLGEPPGKKPPLSGKKKKRAQKEKIFRGATNKIVSSGGTRPKKKNPLSLYKKTFSSQRGGGPTLFIYRGRSVNPTHQYSLFRC